MILTNEEISILMNFVSSPFAKKVMEAGIINLDLSENILRFNNFAFAVREAYKIEINQAAPDDKIRQCDWLSADKKRGGKLSRKEKFKYLIQGRISHNELREITDELSDALHAISDCLEKLNDFVHIKPETIGLDENHIKSQCTSLINSIVDLDKLRKKSRLIVIETLKQHIDKNLLEKFIETTISKLDILSAHTGIEGYYFDITSCDFDEEYISLDIEGEINVVLQYGSHMENRHDDGYADEQSCSFSWKVKAPLNNLNDLTYDEDPEIDTDSLL